MSAEQRRIDALSDQPFGPSVIFSPSAFRALMAKKWLVAGANK